MVKKRFRAGVNSHRKRSFPGADLGGDHDLVMMTFRVRLKKARKPNQPRLRFDLEKLRDPDVACTFQATIGGKFAPLIGLRDEDVDIDTMVTIYNTAVTDEASEILGKERRRKKPLVTKDVLDLCDERTDLKKKRYKAERAKEYREANMKIQKAVKEAKEDWIGAHCEEIKTCLNKTTAREHISWRNRVGPELSRTSLGNVLLKKQRFSADGQNIAQNCTTMRVVETTRYWTAASPRKKICNQFPVRKLRLQ